MTHATPWKNERWLPGVLNKRQLIELQKANILSDINIESIGNDASALDLHLSSEAYVLMKGSIKPFIINYQTILKDKYYAQKHHPLSDNGFLLEKGHCYVFKLKEKIHPYIQQTKFWGQSTAKSTVGRVDLIARLIVDGMSEYENFFPEKVTSGDLFLEVTPITFNVKVREGDSLSQLRFFYGEIEESIIEHESFIKSILNVDSGSNEGTLSVDLFNSNLENSMEIAAAFCAKEHITDPIELWSEYKYSPQQFWENKVSTENNGVKSISIEENRFYILRSKERISLPADVCIYCRAMDESLGEMRIHYAGFVHPHFGENRKDGKEGAPLIFEVRGHNVKVLLTDEEILARLYIYRMSEKALELDKPNPYSNQELTLSKTFKKNWTD
jgi:dCTP deaminase